MKLTIAALILIGICQAAYFSKPKSKQRMVQVIEIGFDHPPRKYVIWEDDK